MLTTQEVVAYLRLGAQLKSAIEEMRDLSKKKPDGAVNGFKLGFLNEMIDEAHRFIKADDRPIKTFEKFDDTAVWSNSDVVMALSQYVGALEVFRSSNILMIRQPYTSSLSSGNRDWWVWDTEQRDLQTLPPTGKVGKARIETQSLVDDDDESEVDDYEEGDEVDADDEY